MFTFLLTQPAWPLPASALRQTNVRDNAGLEEELSANLQAEQPPVPTPASAAGMEEDDPIDDRPVRDRLYPKERIAYLHTIHRAFGLGWAGKEPGKVVFYPGAGSDLFTPFLVADPEVVVMVNRLPLGQSYNDRAIEENLRKPQEAIPQWESGGILAADYSVYGYVRGPVFKEFYSGELIGPLLIELKILGVEDTELVSQGPNYIKLTFDWGYIGRTPRQRELYFVHSTDSADITQYPSEVRRLIEDRGVDIILQKASQIQTYGVASSEKELLERFIPQFVLDHANEGSLLFGDRLPDELGLLTKVEDDDARLAPVRTLEAKIFPALVGDRIARDPEGHRGLSLSPPGGAPYGLWGYAPSVQVSEFKVKGTAVGGDTGPSAAGLEEGKITRREFLAAVLGAVATVATQQAATTAGETVGKNVAVPSIEEVQIARREAVNSWGGITVTPPSKDITKRLLPVFYTPETFHAIPLVAKAGSPFLVIADSQAEEDGVRALLDDLKVGRNQYVIRRSDLEKLDRPASLAKVLQEFTHYNAYPVDPSRPGWLEDLLARLRQEGMIPIGDIASALQATERYFQILA